MKKNGRPRLYTPELADTILERLANGEPLTDICRDKGMPERTTVWRWKEQEAAFATLYTRARISAGESVEGELVDLAREAKAGAVPADAARVVANILTWRAKVLAPRTYGDKLELAGSDDSPLRIEVTNYAGASTRDDDAEAT